MCLTSVGSNQFVQGHVYRIKSLWKVLELNKSGFGSCTYILLHGLVGSIADYFVYLGLFCRIEPRGQVKMQTVIRFSAILLKEQNVQ